MLLGLLGALGSLGAMVTMEHESFASLLLVGPVVFVLGATVSVGVAGSTLGDAIDAFKGVPVAFRGKRPDFGALIERLGELADTARQRGLLALEDDIAAIDDPFLSSALQGVADGTDSADLRALLEDQEATWSKAHRGSSAFFASLGGYAPTIGIVGTVVSLTHVLGNLSTPDKLGPMIASAFIATLWGLLSANFLWLPISTRMRRLADIEVERMDLIIEAVLAIQAGSGSRALGERLKAMVPARAVAGKKKAAKSDAAPIGAETSAPVAP
ncbi:motility protein A [Curtobacterium ammoniigenes]|uniref:motility protein A n=1 Tax=Curtobacterium ammoniigenes TaxID=395387 RepID=UPI000ADCEE6A|nr:MotA/TolQ/ExbB proton channel family protein [Curtobacterium ammoniigenes]